MDLKRILQLMAVFLAPAVAPAAPGAEQEPRFDLAPSVVIDHSPVSSGLYISSPSIVLEPHRVRNPSSVRNTLALTGSPDLTRQKQISATNQALALEMNQAVMVTVELDFRPKPPSIAEALREVERRYRPDDGHGRTFAILDAYGQPTSQGFLHMSMHVSAEKPGFASLVFRRTGQVFWESRIVAGTNTAAFTGKNLLVLIGDGAGKNYTVDGSSNPATILEATLKEGGVPVGVFWPDGGEREITFLYSACGCPVKVMAKRANDRIMRTSDLPVIFPDDPAAVAVINRLMGWR